MARIICPNCAEFISSKETVCPYCKHQLKENKATMADIFAEAEKQSQQKNASVVATSEVENTEQPQTAEAQGEFVPQTTQSGNLKFDAKAIKKDNVETPLESIKRNNAETPVDKIETENKTTQNDEPVEPKIRKRHAHKRKTRDIPEITVEEDGSYNIETRDVTFFEGMQENYSVKKARGEGKPEKIQWWEIYKWADLYLARRKINKEVNKAAVVEPPFVSHGVLLILALLFGWMGAHSFYAKNYVRATVSLVSIVLASVIVSVPALAVVQLSLGGGLGFVAVALWLGDIISILFRKYKFRESKLKFICKLNLATRKKLGKKYENISEWFKPYVKKQKHSKKIRQNKI